LKKVILIAALLFAVFVVAGYLLPKQVHVERSITIDRPAGVVFGILNSYQDFDKWSPWAGRDPQAMFVKSGPKSGVGARLSWSGDPRLVGSGWQEIVASKPYERIDIRLDFDAQGVADTGFVLAPDGESTRVTWFFDSDLSEGVNYLDAFLARYFGLLFDRWVGDDFEQGLAQLKQYAESLPAGRFSALKIERLAVAPKSILYITTHSSQEPADIAAAMAQAYARISAFMFEAGIERTAAPMAITRAWDEGGYEFDAAIPVASIPAELPIDIKAGQSPSGAAVRAVHRGGYDQMMPTYEKLAAYLSAHGLSQGEVSWEQYISDPANTAPADRVTHVYIMLEPAGGQ
jgi:effector-binding domain-containing protein